MANKIVEYFKTEPKESIFADLDAAMQTELEHRIIAHGLQRADREYGDDFGKNYTYSVICHDFEPYEPRNPEYYAENREHIASECQNVLETYVAEKHIHVNNIESTTLSNSSRESVSLSEQAKSAAREQFQKEYPQLVKKMSHPN